MKKVLSLILVLAMALSLAACGKTEPAANDGGSAAATEAPKEEKKDPVDIHMWCIATESDSNRGAYMAAIDNYKKNHPEVNFTWEAIENEEYKIKIKAAVAANEMPDIFFTWGGGFLREFIEEGRVYCVDEEYKNWSSELPASVMGNHEYNGSYYGVPTNFNIVAMFANTELLAQAGYDKVPSTYEDLIKCCDALLAKGIIPFGCSGQETWCVTEYLESIIEKSVGAEKLKNMYLKKEAWNDPAVIDAVGIFQDMIAKGYFDPDAMAIINDEVKANFEADKYAFYINGSWNAASFINDGVADKIVVSEFPVINADKSQLGELIGGANDSLAVAASSKNPEVAARAAFELAKDVCRQGYLDGNGLPAWTPSYDTSSLSALTRSVADIVANSKMFVLFGDNFLAGDNANTYLDYVSKIYAAKIDGKGFVEGLDKDMK